MKRRSGDVPPQARSATISPVSGANLAPWPEQGEQTTKGPCRSRMKSRFTVEVYRQEHLAGRRGVQTGQPVPDETDGPLPGLGADEPVMTTRAWPASAAATSPRRGRIPELFREAATR